MDFRTIRLNCLSDTLTDLFLLLLEAYQRYAQKAYLHAEQNKLMINCYSLEILSCRQLHLGAKVFAP